MEELSYRIEDKTIVELLGLQNFTNDESAILEIVKNAYDAKATEVSLDFDNSTLTIKDNGCGMCDQDIKDRWMRVGFSDKGYNTVDNQNNTRILAGSKGIGRFALSRLGGTVQLFSKKEGFPGIIWQTDWEKSSIEEEPDIDTIGTTIILGDLRQKWTQRRIQDLSDFLSRTYNDNAMKIVIRYPNIDPINIENRFPKAKLGIHCVAKISLTYNAEQKQLVTEIESDEFSADAEKYCGLDLKHNTDTDFMDVELTASHSDNYSEKELSEYLEQLGDFSAVFYFTQRPTAEDVEKFCYKYSKIPNPMREGIILYRNAFSISSFEGKKDWLGLGKRARKSPASPTHPSGVWRVRENQISGSVLIDKQRNSELRDLSNRQGLEENIFYHLFIDIVLFGISNFERYRQEIIRQIDKKNHVAESSEIPASPLTDKITSKPYQPVNLSIEQVQQLVQEIRHIKSISLATKRERDETEERYKYDVRILNVLSTIGLKASSIAHEMRNDRNAVKYNIDYIINALKEYGFWETLNDADHTKAKFQNVPELIEEEREITKKLVAFMDTMLEETAKNRFIVPVQSIEASVKKICKKWDREYAWVNISVIIRNELTIRLFEDALHVILDNLIMNSIQQNRTRQSAGLNIKIAISQMNGMAEFAYSDDGKGLDEKYHSNPRRILDVHETTRPEGHGLGMWIVNNTVIMSGGEIQSISNGPGFSIEFTMGEHLR